jgi:hypothetical protein
MAEAGCEKNGSVDSQWKTIGQSVVKWKNIFRTLHVFLVQLTICASANQWFLQNRLRHFTFHGSVVGCFCDRNFALAHCWSSFSQVHFILYWFLACFVHYSVFLAQYLANVQVQFKKVRYRKNDSNRFPVWSWKLVCWILSLMADQCLLYSFQFLFAQHYVCSGCCRLSWFWCLGVHVQAIYGNQKKIIELYCTCLDFDDDWIYFCVIVFEDAQCYFVGFEKLEILPFFAGDSCETTTK